jgi:UDP-2,3-diacylglucosamine pyrophosphatase LpxH
MEPRPQDYGLLVVSDLHLSEGRHGDTKRFSQNEDFFFDEEFARFLAYYQDAARWNGARWHLIVNGDFLDLLQVVWVDGASSELRRDRDRPGFGLSCGAHEAAFKVRRIADGHWQFFEALASFVASGNLLTILKGNHDVEFHYDAVQEAFLEELERAFDRLPASPPLLRANISPRTVRIGQWFHYEKDLIWIEHGNQYDGANAFRTWLAPLLPSPPGPEADIDLPLGSLFVRYLFNQIESVEPFADNIKPQTRFIRWLLKHHPVTALSFLFGDGRYMLGKVKRALTRASPEELRSREAEHRARLQDLASRSGIETPVLEEIDALRAKNVLEETDGVLPRCLAALVRARLVLPLASVVLAAVSVIGLAAALQALSVLVPPVGDALGSLEPVRKALALTPWALLFVALAGAGLGIRWAVTPEQGSPPSELRDPAEKIASLLRVQYVVMGHTHEADLCPVGRPGGEYFNTGTWTKVFSAEERLIRNDVEFVFLEGLRKRPGELRLKLLEWNDPAREPRLVKLFEDGEVRPRRAPPSTQPRRTPERQEEVLTGTRCA